jgi:hypothetical protein
MIPVGYLAKRVPAHAPDWMKAPAVRTIYSVSTCVNADLTEDIPGRKQNGYGFFNSPGEIRLIAQTEGLDLQGAQLFYYEAYEREFDGEQWCPIKPDPDYESDVAEPRKKNLEGFDVVTNCDGPNSHSPLSCNSLAAEVSTNQHCLFATQEEAEASLIGGQFEDAEPGPYRIYAVYSTDWD